MAKPILLFRFPLNARAHLGKIDESIPEELREEYHILFTLDHNRINNDIEVLNAINATDIEIEELKEKVLNQIKNDVKQ